MKFYAQKEVEQELKNWPGVTYTLSRTNNGHIKVTYSYEGRTRFTISSLTPSDKNRSAKNFVKQTKATLRKLGAVRQ